jgi:cytochrome oxidase Cu insertion factor (SCO1/SenC/PrrC family)
VLLAAAALGVAGGIGARLLLAHGTAATRPAAPALPELHGQATWPAGAWPAPNFALRDQSGRVVSLASLRGRPIAMVFFDSHCTQECPLEGRALATAERSLPPARRPVVVAVSVNPLDTPASARAAARKWGLAAAGEWHWFMGSHAQLKPVWAAYHIEVRPAHGDIEHTEALYLIDRRGYERSGYLYPFLPNFVTLDLRRLAGEHA